MSHCESLLKIHSEPLPILLADLLGNSILLTLREKCLHLRYPLPLIPIGEKHDVHHLVFGLLIGCSTENCGKLKT